MDSSGLASLAAVQLYKSFNALHGQHATLLWFMKLGLFRPNFNIYKSMCV